MVANTLIEWATHTFNPWEGCQKVGPGCDHCYAETRNARFGGGAAPNWGPGAPRRRTSAANWRQPLRWDREAAASGIRPRVFCASLADVFDNKVDPLWRTDLAALIEATPNLDWLLLTKRIGNAAHMMRAHMGWERPPANVWLGATVVNQAEADRDVPKLLATPATKRFLSMEPLLDEVSLEEAWHGESALDPECWGDCGWCEKGYPPLWNCQRDWSGARYEPGAKQRSGLDWIIVGGESGPGARPMHPDWARSLRDQCAAAGVPFLFKQWGDWLPWAPACPPEWEGQNGQREDHHVLLPDNIDARPALGRRLWAIPEHEHFVFQRVGKKAAGRLLDGIIHNAVPASGL